MLGTSLWNSWNEIHILARRITFFPHYLGSHWVQKGALMEKKRLDIFFTKKKNVGHIYIFFVCEAIQTYFPINTVFVS